MHSPYPETTREGGANSPLTDEATPSHTSRPVDGGQVTPSLNSPPPSPSPGQASGALRGCQGHRTRSARQAQRGLELGPCVVPAEDTYHLRHTLTSLLCLSPIRNKPQEHRYLEVSRIPLERLEDEHQDPTQLLQLAGESLLRGQASAIAALEHLPAELSRLLSILACHSRHYCP
ncbi:hypothetical protein QTO34_003358 [Cnephaeus nilssonii]|uniref:Uncharacterized protein n=1 Tax=Cnephaeus nilssonii TaxID=3371016 RepID=A0AA40HQK7_CNENI|nr:hypothetical protein QTO34_003358 [Eptesicus nilssonii]